jgi:hypothetical protein
MIVTIAKSMMSQLFIGFVVDIKYIYLGSSKGFEYGQN